MECGIRGGGGATRPIVQTARVWRGAIAAIADAAAAAAAAAGCWQWMGRTWMSVLQTGQDRWFLSHSSAQALVESRRARVRLRVGKGGREEERGTRKCRYGLSTSS